VVGAVLFDLDGTLVDSERESALAMARVLERELGIRVAKDELDFVVGHSWNEIYELLRRRHRDRLTWSMAQIIARSASEREASSSLQPMPGAVAAVRRLGGRWPRKAIVTGSSRVEASHALRGLGLAEEFPVMFAAEDYTTGKPAPDGYLAAAAALGVPPADCLVIEDSAAGIAAGRAAGALVVAVSAGNFLGQDQSRAHRIVPTLDHVTLELIDELDRVPR
jgi:HAD superfamily hydrolase (TIGR01509 family)